MIQPKLKRSEFIERVNQLKDEPYLNELELRRLRLEAQKLTKSDPVGAYTVQGMIACLEENIDEMREFHGNAIKLAPHDWFALINHAKSLVNAGFFSEGEEIASRARIGDRVESIDLFIEASVKSGNFVNIANLLKEREVLGLPENEYIQTLSRILQFIAIKDIPANNIRAHISLAVNLLHKHHVFFMASGMGILEDEDNEWISYELGIRRPVSDVVKISIELARRLSEAEFSEHTLKNFSILITSL